MQKLARARRAPRRRFAVALVAATALALAGMVMFALPAYANHVGNVSANCNEAVVSWFDFPEENVPVHIVVTVQGVDSTTRDINVNENTSPTHIGISDLTSQLNGEEGTVVVRATWDYWGQHHDEGDEFDVTCGSESTSTTQVTTAPTSTPSTAAATTTPSTTPVTTAGQPATTTTTPAGPATTYSGGPGTTGVAAVQGATAAAGGSSLPFTGSGSVPLLIVGLALVLGGAAAVFAPRYRRHSSES
jgi:LPXTG-motif cell wall-anchored protein